MQSSGGGVGSESISSKVIHSLAQAAEENHIGSPNLPLSGTNMCAHAHTQTCTYKETPPSDTYRYPAAPQHISAHGRQRATCGWRCTGTHSHTTTCHEAQSGPPPPNTQEHMEPTNTCTQCHCTHENAPRPCTKHRNRPEHTHAI